MAATSLVSKCEDALWQQLDDILGAFATQHQATLREVVHEFKITGDEDEYSFKNGEHKLEWSGLHREISGKLEVVLSEWCEHESVSFNEFLHEVNDVLEGKFVPLFEEHENKPFVDLVLSLVDYDSFLSSAVWKLFQLELAKGGSGAAAGAVSGGVEEEGKDCRK